LRCFATSTPFGAFGKPGGDFFRCARTRSNRIGAAAVRPIRPGTGAPSGRPTQTPIVMRRQADRPGVAIAVAGAGLERDFVVHAVFRPAACRSGHADLQAAA